MRTLNMQGAISSVTSDTHSPQLISFFTVQFGLLEGKMPVRHGQCQPGASEDNVLHGHSIPPLGRDRTAHVWPKQFWLEGLAVG